MKFDELKAVNFVEGELKKTGKYYSRGKDYIVNDGDIIFFKVGQVNKPKKWFEINNYSFLKYLPFFCDLSIKN